MKYVIIGNGIAGTTAAETIRRFDTEGDIVMVADERNVPYCRPMISMLLEGAMPQEKLSIRPDNYYESLKIQTVFGDRVQQIDPNHKTLTIQNGRSLSFDKLLIASGADPRPIKAIGLDLKNIFYMRTSNHVSQMLDVLPKAQKALVLGGGLVGFKAAYALLRRGLHVTMLIRSEYPLSMQVDETAGKMILQELMARGLDVKVAVEATAFEGNETVSKAHLSDGTDMPCDLVVIGKGVLPALSFVPGETIEVDLGIRVDPYMQTSAPDIYAAGDVAESVDVARRTPWVNAIWPEAVAQGRLAGTNMAGRRVAYQGSLSRNMIRIFDMDVMTGGLVNPSDDGGYDVLHDFNPRLKTYRKLIFRNDKLAGFAMVNNIEQGGILISLIQNKTVMTISRNKMLEPSFNFKQLMKYS
jgi:NAD(P)H-nitrite reductase large subunit